MWISSRAAIRSVRLMIAPCLARSIAWVTWALWSAMALSKSPVARDSQVWSVWGSRWVMVSARWDGGKAASDALAAGVVVIWPGRRAWGLRAVAGAGLP